MVTGISETGCGPTSAFDYFTGQEGSARKTNRDYLHFLFIARGSLTESQYFIHLAKRLGYVNEANVEPIEQQMKRTFACMHGLVRAVEGETGRVGRTVP